MLTADVIVQIVFFCQMTLKNAASDANDVFLCTSILAVVSGLKAVICYDTLLEIQEPNSRSDEAPYAYLCIADYQPIAGQHLANFRRGSLLEITAFVVRMTSTKRPHCITDTIKGSCHSPRRAKCICVLS